MTENSCQQYMNIMKKLFGKLLKVLFVILNKQLIVYLWKNIVFESLIVYECHWHGRYIKY